MTGEMKAFIGLFMQQALENICNNGIKLTSLIIEMIKLLIHFQRQKFILVQFHNLSSTLYDILTYIILFISGFLFHKSIINMKP